MNHKKILSIGGAVIKTAKEELKKVIENGHVEMLIHNGGSIFHDFQQVTDSNLKSHSYAIADLLLDYECNRPASTLVWNWLNNEKAPDNSITKLCMDNKIPVLMFTGSFCDFWQMFADEEDHSKLGRYFYYFYQDLVERFKKDNFHYICMGSAVIQPEVFIKAIAESKPKNFIADVVDFKKDMYRPMTRVAQFGQYYNMTHKEFFEKWLNE